MPSLKIYEKYVNGEMYFATIQHKEIRIYNPTFSQKKPIKSQKEGKEILEKAGFKIQEGKSEKNSVLDSSLVSVA